MITLGNVPVQATSSRSIRPTCQPVTPHFGIAMHISEVGGSKSKPTLENRVAALEKMTNWYGVALNGAALLDKLTQDELETGTPQYTWREQAFLYTAFRDEFDNPNLSTLLTKRALEKLKTNAPQAYEELGRVVARGHDLADPMLDWQDLYEGPLWEDLLSPSTMVALREVGLVDQDADEITPDSFPILKYFRFVATGEI